MAKNNKVKRLRAQISRGLKNQEKEILDIVLENRKELLVLNKQQLFKGEDSKGKSLGRYKSKSYERFKRKLNPNNVVDLFLTGKFYSRFFNKTVNFPFQIDSKDSKRDKLVNQYGSIFGLNTESKKVFAFEYVRRGLVTYYKKLVNIR